MQTLTLVLVGLVLVVGMMVMMAVRAESRRPLRLAAVGDSITAGSAGSDAMQVNDASWLPAALDDRLVWAGGWAEGGATTTLMAQGVRRVDGTDVLVILAGTNDVSQRVPFAETSRNLRRIVAVVGADRVIVSSIPPRTGYIEKTTSFNAQLAPYVKQQGWHFVDAFATLRTGQDWGPGMTRDGIHPSAPGDRMLGRAIRDVVLNP